MSAEVSVWAWRQRNVPPLAKLTLLLLADNSSPFDEGDTELPAPQWLMRRTDVTLAEQQDALAWLQENDLVIAFPDGTYKLGYHYEHPLING